MSSRSRMSRSRNRMRSSRRSRSRISRSSRSRSRSRMSRSRMSRSSSRSRSRRSCSLFSQSAAWYYTASFSQSPVLFQLRRVPSLPSLLFSSFPSSSPPRWAPLKPTMGSVGGALAAFRTEPRPQSHFAALYAHKMHLVAAFLVL